MQHLYSYIRDESPKKRVLMSIQDMVRFYACRRVGQHAPHPFKTTDGLVVCVSALRLYHAGGRLKALTAVFENLKLYILKISQ